MTATIDFDARYTVDGYKGVAWWLEDHPLIAGECQGHDDLEEATFYCWGDCVEPYRDTARVTAIMVGDDRRFIFDVDELTMIDDDDYCHECGQVGCTHDGRDRA